MMRRRNITKDETIVKDGSLTFCDKLDIGVILAKAVLLCERPYESVNKINQSTTTIKNQNLCNAKVMEDKFKRELGACYYKGLGRGGLNGIGG